MAHQGFFDSFSTAPALMGMFNKQNNVENEKSTFSISLGTHINVSTHIGQENQNLFSVQMKGKNGNGNGNKRKNNMNNNDTDDLDELRRFLFGETGPTGNDSTTDDLDVCSNPLCNHKDYSEDPTVISTPQINVNNINDLIEIGKSYHCKKNKEYNGVSLRILCNLVGPLNDLNQMVGMAGVKESIINQIVFFLQGFNQHQACGSCHECSFKLPCVKGQDDMLHTVITGSPGCGKTELGKILGKVYKALGILEHGEMKIVSRSDLIGKYLGHTAAKTQDVINSCKGGVMFIDEAYSLGHAEGRDSFSKECLDTLNQNLSERRDFLCIIAGYKEDLEKCFFSMNQGLRRRFTFRYDIEKYSSSELLQIFLLKLQKENWGIECELNGTESAELIELKQNQSEQLRNIFRANMNYMPNFGGDVETLFLNCKIVHGKRVLFLDQSLRKILTISDTERGFDKFSGNRKYKDVFESEYTDMTFYS